MTRPPPVDAGIGAAEDAGDEPEACVDRDGDGVGVGDCADVDCDDTDPITWSGCGEDCARYPMRKGCRCEGDAAVACYLGPAETSGRGACAGGLKRCEDGVYGACEGEVLPSEETCNGQDDDCDGEVDEGVLSACGDCSPDCTIECVGIGCRTAFDPDDDALARDPAGALVLADAPPPRHHLIWVANSAEGTVSKLDTRSRVEIGRYRTGPGDDPDPSRTTVNLRGDVVVANREAGSATMIAGSNCPDPDGDGVRTSGGRDDVLPWGRDDCVLWNVGGIPAARGSAFELRTEEDGTTREMVWVASYPYANGPLYEIDAEEGDKTGRFVDDVPGYGAAMGPDGRLWLVAVYGCITSIDTRTLERTDHSCANGEQGYGITVDTRGRVWIGGSVARFDPATGQWDSPADEVTGGGIAVDSAGNAWVGEAGAAWRIDGDSLEATPIPDAGGHGWAVDFDGYAWAIELGDSATIVDPGSLEVTRITPPFVEAYTYSDMTGTQLGNVQPTRGTYRRVFVGCHGPTEWTELSWTGPSASDDGGIVFRVRTADALVALGDADWVTAATLPPDPSPVSLRDALADAGVQPGALLEVEVTLWADPGRERPRLDSFTIEHACSGSE